MRLHARDPAARHIEMVWHVPTCKRLTCVAWVDDETAEYAVFATPLQVTRDSFVTQTHRARRILILPRMVLIDPLEGDEDKTIEALEELTV